MLGITPALAGGAESSSFPPGKDSPLAGELTSLPILVNDSIGRGSASGMAAIAIIVLRIPKHTICPLVNTPFSPGTPSITCNVFSTPE